MAYLSDPDTGPLQYAVSNILRRKKKEEKEKARYPVAAVQDETDEQKPENVKDRIKELMGEKGVQVGTQVQRPSLFQSPLGGIGLPSSVQAQRAQSENGGFTGDPDLDWIIKRESGGKPTAQNPTSSAFGIGQMIRSNRVAYGNRLGFDPDTVIPEQQIAMMKEYIKDRYGSVSAARKFWEKNNWY